MAKIADQVKSKMGTEEEPFEGEVPIQEVEKAIFAQITDNTGDKKKFVFDGYTHKTEEEFLGFIENFGCPDFAIFLTAAEKTIKERWCKKNEAEEVPEDAMENIKADSATNGARRDDLIQYFEQFGGRVNILQINTSIVSSVEGLSKDLNSKFSPKVVLVNHEKQLNVDNSCANLAIKYNMIYVSAYQVIKQHIEGKT